MARFVALNALKYLLEKQQHHHQQQHQQQQQQQQSHMQHSRNHFESHLTHEIVNSHVLDANDQVPMAFEFIKFCCLLFIVDDPLIYCVFRKLCPSYQTPLLHLPLWRQGKECLNMVLQASGKRFNHCCTRSCSECTRQSQSL